MTNIKIEINTYPKFRPMRVIYVCSVFAGLIGIGVVTQSSAMKWAGFMMAFLAAISWSINTAKRDQNLTIDQARKRLDEIERDERSKGQTQ